MNKIIARYQNGWLKVCQQNKDNLKITTVHWRKMSVAWQVMSVMQRNEEVRTQRVMKYEKATYFLENTQGREKSVY
jgi:hypothetical protein